MADIHVTTPDELYEALGTTNDETDIYIDNDMDMNNYKNWYYRPKPFFDNIQCNVTIHGQGHTLSNFYVNNTNMFSGPPSISGYPVVTIEELTIEAILVNSPVFNFGPRYHLYCIDCNFKLKLAAITSTTYNIANSGYGTFINCIFNVYVSLISTNYISSLISYSKVEGNVFQSCEFRIRNNSGRPIGLTRGVSNSSKAKIDNCAFFINNLKPAGSVYDFTNGKQNERDIEFADISNSFFASFGDMKYIGDVENGNLKNCTIPEFEGKALASLDTYKKGWLFYIISNNGLDNGWQTVISDSTSFNVSNFKLNATCPMCKIITNGSSSVNFYTSFYDKQKVQVFNGANGILVSSGLSSLTTEECKNPETLSDNGFLFAEET